MQRVGRNGTTNSMWAILRYIVTPSLPDVGPQTRLRNTADHVPTDLVTEFYAQRASVPGTLLITEATYIAPYAGSQPHAPGIWSEEQIAAWKKVCLLSSLRHRIARM